MSKYKSRSEVEEKYKWDLTDFYKNDIDFNNDIKKAKERIKEEEKYKECVKNSDLLYEFLKYDEETECLVENLYVYSFMKDDEELGNSVNINRKNAQYIHHFYNKLPLPYHLFLDFLKYYLLK